MTIKKHLYLVVVKGDIYLNVHFVIFKLGLAHTCIYNHKLQPRPGQGAAQKTPLVQPAVRQGASQAQESRALEHQAAASAARLVEEKRVFEKALLI